ncbi:MAG: hypothetical protein U0797_23000 [Gemmataceae bacterium]
MDEIGSFTSFSNGPNSYKRKNQILRYKVIDDLPRCDPASRQLVIEWESNGHNGGDLAFGPDGMLYITSGDGTSDLDTDNTGQDATSAPCAAPRRGPACRARTTRCRRTTRS